MGGLKQKVNSILTHVSDTVFHALSHGSLHFVLHGSLITAYIKDSDFLLKKINQSKNCLKSYHGEQNQGNHVKEPKAGSGTGVKSDLAFCLGSLIEKTVSH